MITRILLLVILAVSAESCVDHDPELQSELGTQRKEIVTSLELALADCKIVLTPGSNIARDARAVNFAPKCETRTDARGNRMRSLRLVGKIDPRPGSYDSHDWSNRLVLLTELNDFDANSWEFPYFDLAYLNVTAPTAELEDASTPTSAGLIRYDVWYFDEIDTRISYACAVARYEISNSPFRVAVCRSGNKSANRNEVVKIAEMIAQNDIPNIKITSN